MTQLDQIQQADWKRLEKVPLETRQKWRKDLVDAICKFNNDPFIQRSADARRARAVEIIMNALLQVAEPMPGEHSTAYYFNATLQPEETAALEEFFPSIREAGNKDFESFVWRLGKKNDYKPMKEWDAQETEAFIRAEFRDNTHNIRGMVRALFKAKEFDLETWNPIDQALQALSFQRPYTDKPGADLMPNGNDGFDWNRLRSNLRRAYAMAPEDSVSSKVFPAIIEAADRSGLFEAIEQAYGDTSKSSSLTTGTP